MARAYVSAGDAASTYGLAIVVSGAASDDAAVTVAGAGTLGGVERDNSGSAYAVRGTPVTTRSFIQMNMASVRQSVEPKA